MPKFSFTKAVSVVLIFSFLSFPSSSHALGQHVPDYSAISAGLHTPARVIKKNLGRCAAFVSVCGATFAVFLSQYLERKAEGKSEYYAISDACTTTLKTALTPLICVPTSRAILGKIQDTRVGAYLGLDRRIDLHKMIVALFTLLAATHSICQIAADTGVIKTQEGITGFILWAAIILPLVGSYFLKDAACLKNISYIDKFLLPHQLGFLLFTGTYAAHRPHLKLLPWAAVPIGEVFLDRAIELGLCTHETELQNAEKVGDQLLVTVKRPEDLKINPGQFVYFDTGQGFRPFTIAFFDQNTFGLIISPAGPGTRALHEREARNELVPQTPVSLRGPYPSAFQNALNEKNLILFSTGSGMSVSTALLRGLGELESPPLDHGLENSVTLIHSARNPQDFTVLLDAIRIAKDKNIPIRGVHFFLTERQDQDEANRLENQDLAQLKDQIAATGMHWVEVEAPSYQNPVDIQTEARGFGEEGLIYLHRGRIQLEPSLIQAGSHCVIATNPVFAKECVEYCQKNGMDCTQESFSH